MFNRSLYNTLNVGTTQLYNEVVVYNHKRHGFFKLNNKTYHFVRKHFFPTEITEEFLVVDLLDYLPKLAEDTQMVMGLLKEKVSRMDLTKLTTAVNEYASERSKKMFDSIIEPRSAAPKGTTPPSRQSDN